MLDKRLKKKTNMHVNQEYYIEFSNLNLLQIFTEQDKNKEKFQNSSMDQCVPTVGTIRKTLF